MAELVIFDDAPAALGWMTDLRPSFDVRTGAATNRERIEAALGRRADVLFVDPDLGELIAERHERLNTLPERGEALLVSGRCVLPGRELGEIGPGEALVEDDGSVVAARLDVKDARLFLGAKALPDSVRIVRAAERTLLRHPWDVVRLRDRAIAADLARIAPAIERGAKTEGVVRIGDAPVAVHPSAVVHPAVVLDAEHGPIVIDAGAVVRPMAVISGPAYIGRGSTVVERAHIKANTAIGPVCKVGGEVGGTIFQSHSNKAHEGHLGDSWVGEWVNFGAGTTNSNLLNTYAEVPMRATVGGSMERTGLTFLGCIVGDHVKFAILTRIMTGSSFGTGAMIAGTAAPASCVERFSWVTDAGVQRFRLEKFLEVMRAVMARRKATPSEAYIARVRALHQRIAPPAAGAR